MMDLQVVVHCQMGRSRSILVVSLYLFYSKMFDSLPKALDHVKRIRMVNKVDFPRSELRELAENLISKHPDLFDKF
jgi:protein-tyrosine phosphatase